MIQLSQHGLVLRRETNPIVRGLGGRFYVEPALGGPITHAQLAIIKRIAAGEVIDESDAGLQVSPTHATAG